MDISSEFYKIFKYSDLLRTWHNSIEIKVTTARLISQRYMLYSTIKAQSNLLYVADRVCKKHNFKNQPFLSKP